MTWWIWTFIGLGAFLVLTLTFLGGFVFGVRLGAKLAMAAKAEHERKRNSRWSKPIPDSELPPLFAKPLTREEARLQAMANRPPPTPNKEQRAANREELRLALEEGKLDQAIDQLVREETERK